MRVWRFSDATPGHDSQSRGLVQALARAAEVETLELQAPGSIVSLARLLAGAGHGAATDAPALAVGAGRRTHLPVLAARRAHGARAVVLMRPRLPLACFDLALIPDHDDPPTRPNVIRTVGALNTVRARAQRDPRAAVIALGGPSRHHGWDQTAVLDQIRTVVGAFPEFAFTITDSRRTPAPTRAALAALAGGNCRIRPFETTPPGWLAAQLGGAAMAWISADSVSMVYEALTGGCRVGLIEIPQRRAGRIARGLARLVDGGWVTPFRRWQPGAAPAPPPRPLSEADRCAGIILARWFGAGAA